MNLPRFSGPCTPRRGDRWTGTVKVVHDPSLSQFAPVPTPTAPCSASPCSVLSPALPSAYLRSDNAEFIAHELTGWLTKQGVQTHHIAPGSPWQNAYGESGGAALRQECLNQELFHGVLDARAKTGLGRRRYNRERPHSALGYRTPEEFRDGVRIPLLERGQPSTHHRRRENGRNKRDKTNEPSLYLSVVRS